MTNISVETTSFQVENRSWLLSVWGQGPGENPTVILDISTFTANTHFPNGYIPSGTHLGVITASSDATKITVGPYDDTASDGRQTFYGFLHSATKVPNTADLTKDTAAAAVVCGMVKLSRLPFTLDANGKADAKLFHFTA
jgi:hypothetical protein